MARRGRPLDPKVQEVPRKDGTTAYRVRVRVGGRQTTETFDSKAAARVFVDNVKEFGADEAVAMRDRADPASLAYVPTLAEMLTRHLDELTGVDKRTRDDYLAEARRSWLDTLGRYPVDAVTRSHIARWVNAADGTVAPKTLRNRFGILSAVLKTAMHHGYIEANPASGTRLPRSGEESTDDVRFLTHAEFDRLIVRVPEFWQPFVLLLFGTGLRFSEATALQVHDINPESHTLRVMRAWKREKGTGLRLGPPKSKASRRVISIDGPTLAAIMPLLDRAGDDWLFKTTTGRVVMHSNFYNRIWAPACDAAGIKPRPGIHSSRHTHASWLLYQGARLEYVQERLGHEDFATTRKFYMKLIPAMREESAALAAQIFNRTTAVSSQGSVAALEPPAPAD